MRILVLTHTLIPSGHANAKRPTYLVKAFLERGWQVDVFTSYLGMAHNEPEVLSHQALRVFRRRTLADTLLPRFTGRPLLYRAVGMALAGSSWPDSYNSWVLRVLRESKKLEPYDRVLAFVMPASMLLAGLGRRVTRNWTFDFQESLSPHLRRHPRRSPLQRAMLPALEKLERHTLPKAGHVIFTAESNRKAYAQSALARPESTSHVPYFYDADLFSTNAPEVNPEFEIVYFGTFDWSGARSPETFLRALSMFLADHPEARSRTRFTFYGKWLPEHNRFVEELNLRDVVSIRAAVPYSHYIRTVRSSPILLLVVAPEHNLFMPSKIVDYFGSKRPILSFVPRQSEMAGVLEQAGMNEFACAEVDAQAGRAALEKLWLRYTDKKLDADAGKTQFWSSETQIPRFISLVEGAGK